MTPPEKLPLPTSSRWQLLRAGIQNVWEYDNQRFVFHRGRLLLRGQNESGKTKALEVLLPFLLDASLQPQRLDPFGTNARAMRWNLLNDSNSDATISIGYVWLELGRVEEGSPRYWTLGAGLKARRTATTVEDWYFATPQRVDDSLHLVDANRTPLTKAHLAIALGQTGELFERAADYRRALNDQLFGLPPDQYSALVDALLQLRRPQLSKQLDPDELSRILTASLPPLDSAVVGSLAEGFERLDRHRAEREEYNASLLGLKRFLDVYRGYVGSFVKARSQELTRADSAFHTARAELRSAQEQREATERRREELQATVERLDHEDLELGEKVRTLRGSEAYRAVSSIEEAETHARTSRAAATRAKGALGTAQQRASRARDGLRKAELETKDEAATVEREQRGALTAAQEAQLEVEHQSALAAISRGAPTDARDVISTAQRIRHEALEELRALQKKLDVAVAAVDTAMERLKLTEERLREAEQRLAEAEALERRVRQAFLEAVGSWAESSRWLQLDLDALLDLPPVDLRSAIEPALQVVRGTLEDALRAATLAHTATERELLAVRSEREEVSRAQHRAPAPPAWRSPRPTDRPGAPFYLLCELQPGVRDAEIAGLEAALEASGLLDAWVMPEGQLLDGRTLEAWLTPTPSPIVGRTLAEFLTPAMGAPVPAEVVERMLRSIALAGPNERGEGEAWVSVDGRFNLGPLQGRSSKPSADFLGAAAREQARLRKLAELEARIATLEAALSDQAVAVTRARSDRSELEAEVQSFPSVNELLTHEAASKARAEETSAARRVRAEQLEALQRCEAQRLEAVTTRDKRAERSGLRGWLGRLDVLRERTSDYARAAGALIDASVRATRSAARAEDRRRELAEEETQLAQVSADSEVANAEAVRSEARATTLRAALGQTRDEILQTLRALEERQEQARGELRAARDSEIQVNQEVGALASRLAGAEEKVTASDDSRKEVEGRLRDTVRRGLFSLAGVELGGETVAGSGVPRVDDWSYTDLLLAMRRTDDALAKVDPSDAARDKAWNRVNESHQELGRALRPEIRVIPSQLEGLTLYEATFNARPMPLLDLRSELEADVATRDRLLGEEERKLFESFLTGEAHEHLRGRLREANTLVKRMNNQLAAHPTSSGMQIKLDWDVAEEAPPGTRETVALLFKSGALLSDADRTALLRFLQERLAEARAKTEARTLQEQLLAVLDYRAWHAFQVQCRTGNEGWKRLTKKVHGAGSGGQKAVMLHLPLFAAAAAFFDSARAGAPRLILLDEAFAGIDRETRGQLMGLLSDFDLDFVMTSFEEWGFYPQLDGLSTYHLAREKGMPGVYSDWYVWNGQESVLQVQAP